MFIVQRCIYVFVGSFESSYIATGRRDILGVEHFSFAKNALEVLRLNIDETSFVWFLDPN